MVILPTGLRHNRPCPKARVLLFPNIFGVSLLFGSSAPWLLRHLTANLKSSSAAMRATGFAQVAGLPPRKLRCPRKAKAGEALALGKHLGVFLLGRCWGSRHSRHLSSKRRAGQEARGRSEGMQAQQHQGSEFPCRNEEVEGPGAQPGRCPRQQKLEAGEGRVGLTPLPSSSPCFSKSAG